ncbi:MAG: pseudouridine-5'-phosphate glycosidase [Caldilineales bacterium]
MTTPLLALESTLISHGLPYPHNLETARRLEAIAREHGAEPRTVAVIDGQLRAGLSADELQYLASTPGVRKLSRRDLPIAVARGWTGATTVATTMWIAAQHGIRVFSTGGIGGVHRGQAGKGGAGGTMAADVSADLPELAQTPVAVVCAGAKAILDLPATLEWLETWGVPVIGYGTDEFPAFYTRRSGLPVDVRADTPEEVAAIIEAKRRLGLPGGVLICAPVPEEFELPAAEADAAIEQALAEAAAQDVRGKEITPFLLARIVELTGERSLHANLALLENNVRVGAQLAAALAASND